jgi:hypothetical protein
MEKGKLSLKIEELEDRIAPVAPGFGLVTALTAGAAPHSSLSVDDWQGRGLATAAAARA